MEKNCRLGNWPGKVLVNLIKGSSPKSVTGYDFSQVAIEKAQILLPHGKFQVADIYKSSKAKGDIVLCTEVLEHLENPKIALQNVISSIVSSGLALITVPDGRIDYSLYHINFWSPESWKNFIENACGDYYTFEVGQFHATENSYYKNNFAIISKQ